MGSKPTGSTIYIPLKIGGMGEEELNSLSLVLKPQEVSELSPENQIRRLRKLKVIYSSFSDIFSHESKIQEGLMTPEEERVYIISRVYAHFLFKEAGLVENYPFFKNPLCTSQPLSERFSNFFEIAGVEFNDSEIFNLKRNFERRRLFQKRGITFKWETKFSKLLKSFSDLSKVPSSKEAEVDISKLIEGLDFQNDSFLHFLKKAAISLKNFPPEKKEFISKNICIKANSFLRRRGSNSPLFFELKYMDKNI